MKYRLSLLIFTSILTFAVSAKEKPRIDATTEASLDASTKAMQATLSNKENCLLLAAFMRLQVADKKAKAKETGNADTPPDPLGPKIDKLTYKEIIQKSEKVEANVMSLCRN
jgi:hypothetical protein